MIRTDDGESKNVEPINDNGQRHGYWKMYWYNSGKIQCEGNYINDVHDGLWKFYGDLGELETKYYLLRT